MAINGSPRKEWNTAAMLEHALEGAASKGAETRLFHLYDLDYKGCISCFACKKKGGKSLGRCATRDGLTPLLEEIRGADALILGSPIYFGEVSGEMRSFLERLLFPYLRYEDWSGRTLFPRKIPTAWIYTMNIPEEMVPKMSLERVFQFNAFLLEMIFGPCESLMSFDTLQFEDYSKYEAGMFDAAAKRKRHEEVFPEDCRKAFDLGAKLCNPSQKEREV
ncbi:flavodoxin family protein [Desulforhabdus sp. TSK]|uniref:flavodoxin family protein n=1 Tax=Desulforhabdus sp. TSK TaxID=2925014 RepID=UPI002795981D|nr:flavodoxin family protein [Desulforhabdus sp. TSK]